MDFKNFNFQDFNNQDELVKISHSFGEGGKLRINFGKPDFRINSFERLRNGKN